MRRWGRLKDISAPPLGLIGIPVRGPTNLIIVGESASRRDIKIAILGMLCEEIFKSLATGLRFKEIQALNSGAWVFLSYILPR